MLEREIHNAEVTGQPEELADDGKRVVGPTEPDALDPAELADDGNRLVPDLDADEVE